MTNVEKSTCSCSMAKTKEASKDTKKMSVINIISAVLFFLFPKCPMCWAAYASIFSFMGMDKLTYNSDWKYILLGVFLLGTIYVIRRHYLNQSWINIFIYTLGLLILLGTYAFNISGNWSLYIVAILMLLSNVKFKRTWFGRLGVNLGIT